MGSRKQLMWIQGLLPLDIRKQIFDLYKRYNDDLDLSDHFLIYPPHLSFKRSFDCDRFEEVKDDLCELMKRNGKIHCGRLYPHRISDMIWLRFDKEEEIIQIHQMIDRFLNEKYQIVIDEYDRKYVPHVTLFRDEDEKILDEMFLRIKDHIPEDEIFIDEIIIGARDREPTCFRIA